MTTTWKLNNTRPRVLVVDNNPAFTRTARRLLERSARYVVQEENDPLRVLKTARGFQPDLILLDMMMPELDGATLATELQADWMLRRVPIVFLTALITPEEAKEGRRIDGHRVIAKPVNSFELVRIIEENLPRWSAAA
jgi:two-component system OmpR family response regulator